MIRLGEAAHRTSRAYVEGRRAVQAERAERDRLRTALRRERRTAGSLLRTVGAIAGEQYRAGSVAAYTLRAVDAHRGKPSATVERVTKRRERGLAARARSVRRESRALAADSVAATARAAALSSRRDRLEKARERVGSGLQSARDALRQLASTASARQSCGKLPPAVSTAAQGVAPAATPGVRWTRPVEGYELSAPFGGAGDHWSGGHTGQDFAVPVGTPVRAVGAGRVTSLTCGDGFGISMVVQHGAGLYSQYAHLSAVMARPGGRVMSGQRIALSGDTGNSTGPHLHFEVRRKPDLGSGVDPVPWLRLHGVRL